jgi:hypothetical protein
MRGSNRLGLSTILRVEPIYFGYAAWKFPNRLTESVLARITRECHGQRHLPHLLDSRTTCSTRSSCSERSLIVELRTAAYLLPWHRRVEEQPSPRRCMAIDVGAACRRERAAPSRCFWPGRRLRCCLQQVRRKIYGRIAAPPRRAQQENR